MTGVGGTRADARRAIGALATCVLLVACGGGKRIASAPSPEVERTDPTGRGAGWRTAATVADRARLRDWRDAWMDALAQIPQREIAADPQLFDPDRALPEPLPPIGTYRCRTIKLGAPGAGASRFIAYGWFSCRIEQPARTGGDGDLTFTRLGGSQRPSGTLYRESRADSAPRPRAIFLGSMALGDEQRPMRYGTDANRDLAGIMERIGDRRWRLILPRPRFESLLDIVEIIPME